MLDELRYRRNLLAYPAGVRTGFDPTHLASKGIADRHGFSGVASSGGFINLVTGTAGTNSAGFTGGSIKPYGPNLRLTSGVTTTYGFPSTIVADAVGTIAVIYTVDSAADAGNIFVTDTAGTAGIGLRNTQFVMPGVAGVPHGITMLANTPMFYAASKGPAFVNFVMTNLMTGKVVSAAVANANTPGSPVGVHGIGGQVGAGSITGNVAAAMWAPNHLSMAQLRQWAQDPWAFWYPPRARLLVRDPTALGAVYLDPTQLGTNIVLSNANLTATQMAAATANTRAIAHHVSGKYYCEFTVDVTGDMQVGLCNAVTPLTEYLGEDNTHSIGVDDGGGGWLGAGGTTTAPGLINGHTYGLAIDITSKKAWIKDITAGGLWNNDASANPATGVNGATFTTIT